MPMTSHSAMTSTFRPPAYQSNSVNIYSPACTRVHTTANTVGYIWREYEAVETSICWTRQSQTSYFAPVLPNGKSLEQYVLFLPPAQSQRLVQAKRYAANARPTLLCDPPTWRNCQLMAGNQTKMMSWRSLRDWCPVCCQCAVPVPYGYV